MTQEKRFVCPKCGRVTVGLFIEAYCPGPEGSKSKHITLVQMKEERDGKGTR